MAHNDVVNDNDDVDHPVLFYGREYHGTMDHKRTAAMLHGTPDGTFLVRRSPGADGFFTLSLRFDGRTRHYRIHYDRQRGHYLRAELKHFETVHDLAADGLLDFYMRTHAAPIIASIAAQTRQSYQQSPYMTLNRRKLRALSGDLRRSLRFEGCSATTEATSVTTDGAVESPAVTEAVQNTNADSVESTAKATDAAKQVDATDQPLSAEPISNIIVEDGLPVVYEKTHAFKVHTFKGLNWCELCANFLWGFTAQGVKCLGMCLTCCKIDIQYKFRYFADCGFVAHQKCSELVPPKCVPDLKRIRGVFGTDLTKLVAAHQCHIPFVVRRCVDEVEVRGMLQEGIYRVSGFSDEIDALKMALDSKGEQANMSDSAYENVHVIAGTLKMYLRLLPVPLVTYQAYGAFIQCASEYCFLSLYISNTTLSVKFIVIYL